ncbi:hypothetical protein FACS1894188_12330 [Clostridia bacterium]|nr:hypothetical protein FACS1894188_12330 [Clostridia bacterium]
MSDKKPYSDPRWYDNPFENSRAVPSKVKSTKAERAETTKILVRMGVLTEEEYQEEVKRIYADEY